jgi:integrase/recombinase XerD
MTIETYPKLTNANTDFDLVRWWVSTKSVSTRKTYLMVYKQFSEFTGKALADIVIEDILLWLESYQLRGASLNTIRNKSSAIKSLFNFARKTGYLSTNPCTLIKSLQGRDALHERRMSEEEVKMLIMTARTPLEQMVIKLLYFLGLRVSEMLDLKWSHFQPVEGGYSVEVIGKGMKHRILFLNHSLWEQLQSLPRMAGADFVFITSKGHRYDRHSIHRVIKGVVHRAGVNPQISAHWLRHAHASHSLKHGASIELLMKSLGHSSLDLTSRYLHIDANQCTSKFLNMD